MKPARRKTPPVAPPAMVAVTLVKEHEHQRKLCPPGTVITVHPDTAQWLQTMGVISSPQSATQPLKSKD